MMYAFLLRNLMNFSRHHRQHLHRQMRHRVSSLLYFLSLLSMYSKIVLIILMMAMMREPKATVPKWKKTALQNERHSGQVFRFFLSYVQYQEAKVPARTSCGERKIISPPTFYFIEAIFSSPR